MKYSQTLNMKAAQKELQSIQSGNINLNHIRYTHLSATSY